MPIRLSGINSGLDTDAIVQELVSAYSLKTEKYEKEQTKIEWKQDAWKSLNTKIYSLYTNVSNLRFDSAYNLKKTTVSNANIAKVTAASGAVAGTQKLNVYSMAQACYITGGKLEPSEEGKDITSETKMSELGYTGEDTSFTVKTGDKETEIKITKDTTMKDVLTQLKDAGLNANFDENNGRIFVSAKESGEANDFELISGTDAGNNVLSVLGLNEEKATKIEGKDAEIKLNGVTYTSTSNTFSINGLTIEVTGVTNQKDDGKDESSAVSLATAVDTQGIYDKIKDFLTEYNNVINEITKLYNAESASDYEPLTDEEKDAMSDEQIEKWENKIKSALLRRDSSLGGIMNVMVNSMAQTMEVNGEKLSLSTFGIQTLGFLNAPQNEHYAYHINGDEDDENTSGKEDKLMKAIQENPDQICEFMKKLTSNLYTAIDNKMKSTELSSAYKVYNDKELDSQLTKYKKLISDWEDKVSEQEEYYYNKFAQMETALSKLQNQTSALSGLLGQ